MKKKALLIIPMCLALLTGCANLNIVYPQEDSTKLEDTSSQGVENFFVDSPSTYTDNTVSKTLNELYEICKKSTVTIEMYVTTDSTKLYSSGSGFIVAASENYLYIYTNAHVVTVSSTTSNTKITPEVIFSDYSRYSATIIASDSNEDVAVLRIDKPNTDNYLIASLGDSSSVQAGDPVFAIGSPLGLTYSTSVTAGIVSGVNIPQTESSTSNTTLYMIETDTALNPGNSGGPLFNYNGEVIGVNTLKILSSTSGTDVDSMGFSIPINHFKLVADVIQSGETYTRPLVGITVRSVVTMSLTARQEKNITIGSGLYIEEVSNTANGLSTNTIVTKINGINVNTLSDFATELYKYKVGEQITITCCDLSGNNETTKTVTLI